MCARSSARDVLKGGDDMDEHAQAVAARWAKKRAAALADGMSAKVFDNHFLNFLRWGGWSEEKAQAIVDRARRLHEKGVAE